MGRESSWYRGSHTASRGGGGEQSPVSGGIFNWQTLAWQKPDGMALGASVALRESESKERSPGEQREKITQPRAVKREEEITSGEKQVPPGTPRGPKGKRTFPQLQRSSLVPRSLRAPAKLFLLP